ncbi:hypothetical protein N7455_010461 [Penicillium solitum]|uniref:uncharacterized protein n=1 Tax=Penicillium solitum TaxID=60172 RepID=UPI0032C49F3E|nr:hypothetical protein N7455_010461 [Penicillium solitum]
MSAEDYYFIALGYPQRMMQSSHLSGAWEEQDTAGAVKGQEVLPSNKSINSAPNKTRSSVVSDLSNRSEKITTMRHANFTEASRFHANQVESGLPRNSQGFLAWAPVLVTGPVRPEYGPMKSGIQTYIDDGRAGSAGVQE